MSYNPLPPLGQTTMTASLPVAIASNQSSLAVTGTFYQTTQPVSIASSVAVTGTFYQTTQPVSIVSSATGGDTTFHLVSAATTNLTNIKASAGKVTGWYIYNSNASARKVAFHNTAGTPTAGSGVVSSIVIPGLAAANVSFPDGIDFSTGIAISTVTDLTDAGTTAVALNDLIINIYYK